VSNLAKRVAVGIVAIPIIYFLCMAGGPYFFAFVALVSAVALREFYALTEAKGARPLLVLGISGGFVVNLSFFIHPASFAHLASRPVLVPALLVLVIACTLWELFRKPDSRSSALLNLSTTLFGVLYVSLFFGTLIGVREIGGGYMVMSMFVTIWICDSAAFHVGSSMGRHKLFPRVSPNKTWEGAVAGLIVAILTAVAAKHFVLAFLPLSGAIAIGVVVGTVGQMGDLAESLMKRDAGVKDSSTLIPGHGGAFDRFDSILLVAPCVYLYLEYFLFP
jgi:phosphatidate cytidylyltransferase